MPNVLTRATCWSPPPCQATTMPFGSEIRSWRRVPQRVSVIISQGKGTNWMGREPIEQKFLCASTLATAGVALDCLPSLAHNQRQQCYRSNGVCPTHFPNRIDD